MEIDVITIMNLYKEKLSNTEHELLINRAKVIALEQRIEQLEGLLKENNIEIAKEM